MWTRRQLLRLTALGLGGSTLGCASTRISGRTTEPDFSFALLCDPHIYGRKGAVEGTRLAVEHALAQPRPPERVLTGGDLVYDVLETGEEEAEAQFRLLEEALAPVRVPLHHTLGNHDCFGVYETSGVDPAHPLWGKALFLERLGLERAYYSFDHERWHFVVLDTVQLRDGGYRGWVDAEQLAWLEDDLAVAARPTVVIGHIPLFSNYIEWNEGTEGGIPERVSVVNSHRVAEVLVRHPVRLVLAGHLHVNETFHYQDITFANVGAVSGNWWDGLRDGFEEGYTVLEFRDEQVDWRYVDYGWEVREDRS